MAEWVGDNVYINISGGNLGSDVEVSSRWKMAKMEGQVDPIDVTRGSNQKHKRFLPGMHEYPLEIRLGIDDTSIYPDELELDQVYTITLAPNGNTAGEPLHVQDYFIESIPLEIETGRDERVYAVKFKQASAPTTNMFELGVVAA